MAQQHSVLHAAVSKAQDAMIEAGRALYVDNRPVSARDINMACKKLDKIAQEWQKNGADALERAQVAAEEDERMPAGEQVVLLLGIAMLGEELESLEE